MKVGESGTVSITSVQKKDNVASLGTYFLTTRMVLPKFWVQTYAANPAEESLAMAKASSSVSKE